jgi:hypothetical protein
VGPRAGLDVVKKMSIFEPRPGSVLKEKRISFSNHIRRLVYIKIVDQDGKINKSTKIERTRDGSEVCK